MGIKPVKVKNIVPNYNLSAIGCKKLPSLEAWEFESYMCMPSTHQLNQKDHKIKNSICVEIKIYYYWLGNVVTLSKRYCIYPKIEDFPNYISNNWLSPVML